MFPVSTVRLRRVQLLGSIVLAGLLMTGCGKITTGPPAPTPADFQGIAGEIVQRGIRISNVVSGDAGCDDLGLAKTAIAFDAVGLDQATPVRVYVYIFRNRAAYERLRSAIDACARAYVTDPATYETVETSPYVLSAQGPWGPLFKDNLRAAIVEAAGTGD